MQTYIHTNIHTYIQIRIKRMLSSKVTVTYPSSCMAFFTNSLLAPPANILDNIHAHIHTYNVKTKNMHTNNIKLKKVA